MNKLIVLIFALSFALLSCITRNNAFQEVDKAFNAENYPAASKLVSENKKKDLYKENDLLLQKLDMGSLEFYSGNFKESIDSFSKAEDLIAEYFTKSITEAAGSMLANDTVLTYSGEDFEDIYLNVFKSLAFLQGKNFDGAFVEIKRLQEKLDLLESKYDDIAESSNKGKKSDGLFKTGTSDFSKSALALYLSALIYRTDKKLDDAKIDVNNIKKAFKSQASIFDFAPPPVDDILKQPNSPHLNFVVFTGRSPIKKAITFRIQTYQDYVRVALDDEDDKGFIDNTFSLTLYIPEVKEGYNFKCQVPVMDLLDSPIKSIEVIGQAGKIGSLKLIERLDKVAQNTFKIKEPLIYVKTIIRTVVKGIAAGAAKNAATENFGLAGALLGLVADGAVELSEIADLRSSRYFPGKAWVGDFIRPEGADTVTINYLDAKGRIIVQDKDIKIDISSKNLNLITGFQLDKFPISK